MVKLPNQIKNMVIDYVKEEGYDEIKPIKDGKLDFAFVISSSKKKGTEFGVQKMKKVDKTEIAPIQNRAIEERV